MGLKTVSFCFFMLMPMNKRVSPVAHIFLLAGKKVVVRKDTPAKKLKVKEPEAIVDAIDNGQVQTKAKVGSKLKSVVKKVKK